jgi:predicted DNA-binding transcriptional regulator AlpA
MIRSSPSKTPELPELALGDWYLSVREAAALLSLSKSWLDKRRIYGGGPPFHRLGRRVVYRLSDLVAWASAHRQQASAHVPPPGREVHGSMDANPCPSA